MPTAAYADELNVFTDGHMRFPQLCVIHPA